MDAIDCLTHFKFYYPNNLENCPYIAVVSWHPHSYPKPKPMKTPVLIKGILEELLLGMNWRLADATPQKLNLDSGFLTSLTRVLAWDQTHQPTLFDLHPSFNNYDHA
ncbi:hypothetical protein M422DRAFT_243998 [Sphaerobolus stellatus SS14]|nr:hypothetical protein M422DRAFT_243998 [Sphaerobolus stellatus SS14]